MAVTEDAAAVPRAAVHPVAPLGFEHALLLSIAARAAPTVVTSCATRPLWPYTRPRRYLPNHDVGNVSTHTMWNTPRTSFLARPLSTSGSTSSTRATLSRYQIRYRS
eukprot:9479696-Pyramimonas_sp.AAC.1